MNTVTTDTRFIGLQVEGFKKIKMAVMDFDGKRLVPIYGKNGAGKSSIIEAIEVLFRGGKAVKEGIVNNESDKAIIIGEIDGYVIRREINKNNEIKTVVKSADGKTIAKPQEFLDAISGYFIDPQDFSALSGKEKKDRLMKYAGISFTEIDSQIKDMEDERLLVGREVKKIGEVTPVEKVDPVVLTELLQQRTAIEDFNREQMTRRDNLKKADDFISGLDFQIKDLEAELKELHDKKVEAEKRKGLMAQPEAEKAISAIDIKILSAELANQKATAYQNYLSKKADKEAKEAEYKQLTDDIEGLREFKGEVLKGANLPLGGELLVTETGLEYKGIPDQNWSDAESIKISAHIAAHFSKDLKAMYIKRGESLDSTSLSELKEFAEENNYQIFCHIVSDAKGENCDGFYLEDGEIVID